MSAPLEKQIEIVNKLGLHARAAAKFVSLASGFESEILVKRGDKEVNGKSIMGVMMLAAGKGATIVVSAEGGDAEHALEEIQELIENRFGEPE